jgi:hypothetical protein
MNKYEYISNAASGIGRRPYLRITLVCAISLILILAATGLLLSPAHANQDKKVHVTGTIATSIFYVIMDKTAGNLHVSTRAILDTWTGGISGTDSGLQQRTENLSTGIAHTAIIGPFEGTIGGSAPGSANYISHTTGDTSGCPCPPGLIKFTGSFVFVAGTGEGGLAGICGGGTFVGSGDPVNGFTTTYDATFQFGASCHSQG